MKVEIITLIGFKHVGKSTLAEALAKRLAWPFYDLDRWVEQAYASQQKLALTCRQIMAQHGETYFRQLESDALKQMPVSASAVIALGGGAPLTPSNQLWLAQTTVIHVTASPQVVFARIMASGVPEFFSKNHRASPQLSSQQTFDRLWQARHSLYQSLAQATIDNDGDVTTAMTALYRQLIPIVSGIMSK